MAMALKTSDNALDMLGEESEWIIAVCLAGSMYMVTLISVQVTGEIQSVIVLWSSVFSLQLLCIYVCIRHLKPRFNHVTYERF